MCVQILARDVEETWSVIGVANPDTFDVNVASHRLKSHAIEMLKAAPNRMYIVCAAGRQAITLVNAAPLLLHAAAFVAGNTGNLIAPEMSGMLGYHKCPHPLPRIRGSRETKVAP